MSSSTTLTVRVPKKLDERLTKLAEATHRTKTFYACEALNSYIEELEDTYIAIERLNKPSKTHSMETVIKGLNLTEEERKEIGLED